LSSVIIGVTLGVTREGLVPLICAIVFHQFVEGMGLAAMLIEVCVASVDDNERVLIVNLWIFFISI
jgi:hypothetical protein